MGSPLDSSQFIRLLDKRLREVAESERKYDELEAMIPRIFRVIPSDSAWEEFYEIGAVPNIPEFAGKLEELGIAPGYHKKIEHKEYAAVINSERKLIDDKKYGVLDNIAQKMMRAGNRTKEEWAVRLLTGAFSASYDFMSENDENLSVCNDSHTTKAGTSTSSGFDNKGTTKFSKVAVAAARLAMRRFRNDISKRIGTSNRLGLIVPDALADDAYELVKTRESYNTAEGNVNMAFGRYEVIPWLLLDDDDTDNWFMVDLERMKDDVVWMNRIELEPKNTVDFDTYMYRQAIYGRWSYGYLDWRWIYGSSV